MTDAFRDQLASLAQIADRLPSRPLPGPAIGRAQADGLTNGSDQGAADLDLRATQLDVHLPAVSGMRVLVVGERTAADAQMFTDRGAGDVTNATIARDSAGRNGTSNGSSAGGHAIHWHELASQSHGTFDLVHCGLVLHRCPDPMRLLDTLRDVTAPGGTLLMATMMLADPERSEYLRFVPAGHGSDPSAWFVPGRLAVRWMLQAAGYDVQEQFGEQAGPGDRLALVTAYLRATAGDRGSRVNGDLAADRLGDRVAAGDSGTDRHLPGAAG